MTIETQNFAVSISKQVKLRYHLHLPTGYDADQQYPLMLFLHGAGERGDDLTLVKKHGPIKVAESGTDLPFIIAAPQCDAETVWWTTYPEALIALINRLSVVYAVDTRRIYLTGLSMGGYGTWDLASHYPDRFAAIAPICGGLPRINDPAVLAAKIKHIPTWIFHGALDSLVPVGYSRAMHEALQAADADVQYTEYPDLDHDSWTITYENPELYQWFLKHSL